MKYSCHYSNQKKNTWFLTEGDGFFLKKVPSDNCNLISATSSRWLLATESTYMGLSKDGVYLTMAINTWRTSMNIWEIWTHWNWVCLIYFLTDPNKSQLHPYCWYQHIIYRIKRCWCNIDSNMYHWISLVVLKRYILVCIPTRSHRHT